MCALPSESSLRIARSLQVSDQKPETRSRRGCMGPLLCGSKSDETEQIQSDPLEFLTGFTCLSSSGEADSIFVDDAVSTDRVDHLILVVHGVGSQKDGERGIQECCTLLSKNLDAISRTLYTGDPPVTAVRAIEWHSTLHKDWGWDGEMSLIALDSIRKARLLVQDTLGDCFLLMSPRFHDALIAEVAKQLNESYDRFVATHPNFSGCVSIFAHSLGSCICFDILSVNPADGDKELLKFQVDNFYMVGSPAGAYVSLMGKQLPRFKCVNVFNLYHPHDPVAYRIEPWADPSMAHVEAVGVPPYFAQIYRTLFEKREAALQAISSALVEMNVFSKISKLRETRADSTLRLASFADEMRSALSQRLSIIQRRVKEPRPRDSSLREPQAESERAILADIQSMIRARFDQVVKTFWREKGAMAHEELEDEAPRLRRWSAAVRTAWEGSEGTVLPVRMETALESVSEYIGSLRAHLGYWESKDVAMFVLEKTFGMPSTAPLEGPDEDAAEEELITGIVKELPEIIEREIVVAVEKSTS